MAVRYVIIDKDDNEFEINDDTWTRPNDAFDIEVDIIEKSFRAGADFPGQKRTMSRELEFTYDHNKGNDDDFRSRINELMLEFSKAVKIRDDILNLETDVIFKGKNIQYSTGGLYRGASIIATFVQPIPYWEDLSFTEVLITNTAQSNFSMTNSGFVESPPLITITATQTFSEFSLRVTETLQGVVIVEPQFGLVGLDQYIIDCKDGTFELNGLDRKASVQQGTGPFLLPVGDSTVEWKANGRADVSIKFKKRFYI